MWTWRWSQESDTQALRALRPRGDELRPLEHGEWRSRAMKCGGCFSGGGGCRAGVWWGDRGGWPGITVQRSRGFSERVETRGGRLVVTDAARDAIRRLCRDTGRQALVLSWPGGAVCLPSSLYTPTAFDVIIGHIARCPIFVDLRRLG